MADRPAPPSGLQAAGRKLWRSLWHELPAELEFDGREVTILTAACRQADSVAALERSIKRDGVTVKGASGQRRLNAAVTEARQARLALARLLGDIEIPSSAGVLQTTSSMRARKAADARWADQALKRDQRG